MNVTERIAFDFTHPKLFSHLLNSSVSFFQIENSISERSYSLVLFNFCTHFLLLFVLVKSFLFYDLFTCKHILVYC